MALVSIPWVWSDQNWKLQQQKFVRVERTLLDLLRAQFPLPAHHPPAMMLEHGKKNLGERSKMK